MKASRSPRLARGLLRLLLPKSDREGAVQALDEKYAEVLEAGLPGSRRWYWRQVAGLLHPRMWAPRRGGSHRSSGGAGQSWMHDLRFGLRMLAKSPGTTVVIIITLAVGLGFNGVVYSLLHTMVLMELPFEGAERIRFVSALDLSRDNWRSSSSYPDFTDFAAASVSFESFALWRSANFIVAEGGELPERIVGAYVSPSIFDVLGFQPPLGRRLRDADGAPEADAVVLVGYGTWQSRYGGDPNIVGRSVRVQGRDRTIVGVLPRDLQSTPFLPDIWVPVTRTAELETERDKRYYSIVGRLAPEAIGAQAAAELERISARLADAHPDTNEDISTVVRTFRGRYGDSGNSAIAFIMMGAVGMLLLIACANVANLLISRILHRGREVAVRMALGASRWRVIRQLLVESMLMSAAGGAGGIVIAVWGYRGLAATFAESGAPSWWDFTVPPDIFALIATLAVATGLVFGFAPALQATRANVGDVLKDGARGSSSARTQRLTSVLVVVQVSLAIVLLAGAGVMTRSAMNLERVDWGLDTDLLTVRLALAQDSYPGPESRIAFHDQLAAQLRAVPGVQDVAIASNFPSRGGFTVAAEIEDLPLTEGHAPQSVTQVIVGTGYFDLARVDPQRGRFFTNSDGRAGERVVVIEQRFADRFWPGEDALGKRLRWDGGDDVEWMRVVGIAPRILHSLPMDFLPDQPVIYTPYRAEPLRNMGLMVRSDADLETLTASLRETVRAIDAELPLFSIVPLRSLLKEATFGWRFTSALFATLGLIALFLSCLGLYAVMAFAITRRQQEIGVRMALGARAQQVVKLVLRAAMLQAGAGLVIGILGALAATRLLRMFMFEVSTADPLAFGLAVGLLLLTALVASWLPALRASRVDPLEALRTD